MKLKIRILLMLILTISMSFLYRPIVSSANEEASKVVRVGYYENEVFEEGAYDGAVKKGYAYEYYRKLSEYTGWKYEYVYGNFVEIYQMLLNGEVDLVAGLAYTDEREGKILYPERAMGAETYSLVKHETDSSISSELSSISGKKIGVLNSAVEEILNDYLYVHKIDAEIVLYSEYETLFAAFDRNEVDIMAVEAEGTYERNHAEVVNSFGNNDYYICVNKRTPELLEELNNAQEQLFKEDPDYVNYLRNKYFTASLSSRVLSKVEKKWLSENSGIKIGYLNNYLPYSDTDKNGDVTGIVKEIFADLFKKLGISINIEGYRGFDNYEDMTKALESGEIDVAFPVGGGLFYSEEDGLYLSNPVISSIPNLIYSSDYISESDADFAVNVNNRMQYYYIKTHYPDSGILLYNSTEDCLDAVLTGQVKGTTLNGLRTNDLLKNRKYKSLSFRQLQNSDDRCFGVKIGNEGLLKLLNRGLNISGREYAVNLAYKYSQGLYYYSLWDAIIDNMWIVISFCFVIILIISLLLFRDRSRKIKEVKEKELQRIEIENANNSKTLFLNNLSEDMHNLVDTIMRSANTATNCFDESVKMDSLDRIKDSCNHLMWLVDDVHDLSSVESGQFNVENNNISFRRMINDLKTTSPEDFVKKLEEYDFRGKRILIVVRNKKNQLSVADAMKISGFEVQVANKGREAVDIISAAPAGYFDYMLVDIQDPNIDGYEAARQIRNLDDKDKAGIPIVAVSANIFNNQ